MFFQTAGIEINPWIPPLVAFVISLFTSMGGVSGAFLLLTVSNVLSGIYRPFRQRHQSTVQHRGHTRRRLPLLSGRSHGLALGLGRCYRHVAWSLYPAPFIRVAYLPDPKHFKLFAAGVLLYIGFRIVRRPRLAS